MDRYEDYKDSGVSWLGKVPEHWETVKIKNLFTERDSLFIDGDWIESKDIGGDDVHYFTTGNIQELKFKYTDPVYITDKKFLELNCTEVHAGDLLVSRLNLPLGRSCLAPSLHKRAIVSVDVVIFRPDKHYNKKYLLYLFNSAAFFQHTEDSARGAIMKRISRNILGNVKIPLPSSAERQSIADFLDEKTAMIDQAIAIKEKEIQLLKERRQILIQELVTGKKVWDGSSWTAPTDTKDSGVDWIGEIPKHWEVRKLKYTIKKAYSGGTPSTDNSRYWDGGIPWVSSVDVKTDKLSKTSREISVDGLKHSSAKIAPAGSLVFVTRSGILQHTLPVAILLKDMAINQDIKCILFQRYISATFFRYLLNGNNDEILNLIRQQAATVESIDMDAFFNLQVPILPITEQDKIVQKCTAVDSEYQKIIALKHTEIQKLKEYKTVLINDVVTGKLRVHAGSGKQLTKGPVYS